MIDSVWITRSFSQWILVPINKVSILVLGVFILLMRFPRDFANLKAIQGCQLGFIISLLK